MMILEKLLKEFEESGETEGYAITLLMAALYVAMFLALLLAIGFLCWAGFLGINHILS